MVRSASGEELVPYTSPARVLISGLGSDELLGGYSRHRNAFVSGGWQGLIDEVRPQFPQRGPVTEEDDSSNST